MVTNTYQLIENYSPTVDMVSVVISGMLLFVIARVLYFSRDSKFLYLKKAVHLIFVGSIVNISFFMVVKYYPDYKIAIFLLRDIYHICFLFCLYYYAVYMREMLDVNGTFAASMSHFTLLLLGCVIILEILSPVTKIGLCIKDGRWSDKVVSPYNFYYMYTVLILLGMLIFYSNRLIKSLRLCLIFTEAIVATIMAYQAVLNINTFSSFTYVIPILVVMILLHSKPFDDKTGSLSASSFESFVAETVRSGNSVDYMILKLNLSVLNTLPNELGKVLNSFWHDAFKDALLFNLEHDLYMLAIPREAKNGNTEEKIKKLIGDAFHKYYLEYQINYKVIGLFDIDFVESESDLTGIIKYLLASMDVNTIFYVDEKKREELRLLKYIRENLAKIEGDNDLDDPRVLVYCQPIRNMQTGKYDTAEALMRLLLPDQGLIMPGMFITLAEQYGHIHTLTRIMLNKVCKLIKQLEADGYDFKRISINFAASEIKAGSFCDDVFEIVRQNGVDPSKIGIELTESQTESDFKILKEKMEILRNAGMTLYLDDVGTGYSNLDRIVRYDVDVVKFDRFFLLEAERDEKVGKMLKHLSEAFRDLDYELLYEGVETVENENLCLSCGADYIQGFKYSKPVPMEKLGEFFDKK